MPLTFGGSYAVLPYVYQGAVEQFAWVTGPLGETGAGTDAPQGGRDAGDCGLRVGRLGAAPARLGLSVRFDVSYRYGVESFFSF